MDFSQALPISSCLIVPTIGIAFADILFVGTTRRYLIPFVTLLNLGFIVFGSRFPRGMPAYLTGVLTSWITLRVFIIFGIYGNPNSYLRLKSQPDQSGRFRLTWTSPLATATSRVSSLYWALELMTDFRGTRWCYSSQEGHPCEYHKRVETSTSVAVNKHRSFGFVLALRTMIRLIAVSTFLWLYNTWMHPTLRSMALGPDSGRLNELQRQAFVLLRTALMTFSTWCAVDILHSGCKALYTTLFLLGVPDTVVETTQTSPWGTLAAIWLFGIRGFWGGLWHDYLKLGLKAISNYMRVRASNAGLNVNRQVFRILIPFWISGLIHVCGSLTLGGDSQPLTQLTFFMVQGLGLVAEGSVDKHMGLDHSVLRGVKNVLLFVAWFHTTFKLLGDDLERGGFWW